MGNANVDFQTVRIPFEDLYKHAHIYIYIYINI